MGKAARLAVLIGLPAVLAVQSAQPVYGGAAEHLSGGGTATISQVAMNVRFDGSGAASGSFECLMAGRSRAALGAFGLSHVMAVHATVDAGEASASLARFSGPARINMDNGQHLDVHVQVWVDTATQHFQLAVVEIGSLPVETMLTGQVALD